MLGMTISSFHFIGRGQKREGWFIFFKDSPGFWCISGLLGKYEKMSRQPDDLTGETEGLGLKRSLRLGKLCIDSNHSLSG
jgi:hypothetical protein